MATLVQFSSDILELNLMQNSWSNQLNPLLTNPSLQSSILTSVALIAGTNTINHKLGRKLQGWRIVRKRAAADIYDTQDSNQMPNLTLVLVSSAPCTVDLECF